MSAQNRTSWRQIFHWPLFTFLAFVHIALLPLLFSEPKDDVVSFVAGGAYLALALADWRSRDPLGQANRAC